MTEPTRIAESVAVEECGHVSPTGYLACQKAKGHKGYHFGETATLYGAWAWDGPPYPDQIDGSPSEPKAWCERCDDWTYTHPCTAHNDGQESP